MPNIEKIQQNLSKGYTPQSQGAPKRIANIYDKTFKPLVNRKNLEAFFKIYENNDPILKAWAFLGIYQVLENKTYETEKRLDTLHEIVLDLLDDNREIKYISGEIETKTTLRKHHVSRVCWLNPEFVFEPVYKYCKSSIGKLDKVVSTLLEEILSKHPNQKIETLLLDYADEAQKHQLFARRHIIKAFENLGQNFDLKNRPQIESIFRNYLNDLEDTPASDKKRVLKDNIIRISAKIDLNMEKETFTFLRNLKRPYDALKIIAQKYKSNDKLHSILLQKLNETNNRNFINDILRAILVIQDEIPNAKEIIIENVKKNRLNQIDLIIDLTEENLLNENLILNFLQEGKDWQLEFVREFLITFGDVLSEWEELQKEIISILNSFEDEGIELKPEMELYKKKKMLLQLIIDLKWEEMVEYCIKNFASLQNDKLRKMALFSIITFGNDKNLTDLRRLMDKNKATEKYVKNFWDYLERRDWKFYY
jgi:hypothetical protein